MTYIPTSKSNQYNYGSPRYSQASGNYSLKVVPLEPYKPVANPFEFNPLAKSSELLVALNNTSTGADFEDFFRVKEEISDDKIALISDQISQRSSVRYQVLGSIYEDLLKVSNWRLENPTACYLKDKQWEQLNSMELKLREQIRRELKDSINDLAFPQKDLREGVLEAKLQKSKSSMLDMGGLEEEVGTGFAEGSYNIKGDLY